MISIAVVLLAATLTVPHALRVCHHNDFHAKYAEINRFNLPCSPRERLDDKCFSGVARIAHAVNLLGCDLVVHAGDFVQGSVDTTNYGTGIASQAFKWVGYDVAVLGNHEFNNGPTDVYELVMSNPETTFIASNVHFENAPADLSISPFMDAFDICWVSALTTSTGQTSNPGPSVLITDEAEAVNDAVAKCSQNQSVIAITHVGFEKDISLCEQISTLDVVIGGHSHTNLDQGAYPHKVVRDDGSVCWVLTAYAYGRYIGFVDISFREGVADLSGHAYIPMDYRIPLSEVVAAELENYTERLDKSIKQTVAVATEAIDGSRDSCRGHECPMGNLVCDALLDYAVPQHGAQVCLLNGGGIRASIDAGDITPEDIFTVLPFRKVHALLTVSGSTIVAALENGFLAVSNDDINGRFPQIGGMKVVVDFSKSEGSRVVSVVIGEEPIDFKKKYKLVTSDFLVSGGDGYDWSGAIEVELSGLGLDALVQRYLAINCPYTPLMDDRIVEFPV